MERRVVQISITKMDLEKRGPSNSENDANIFRFTWSKEFEDDYAGVATKTAGSSLADLVDSSDSVWALGRGTEVMDSEDYAPVKPPAADGVPRDASHGQGESGLRDGRTCGSRGQWRSRERGVRAAVGPEGSPIPRRAGCG